MPTKPSVDELLTEAAAALHDRDLDTARSVAESALEADPDDPDALFLMGAIQFESWQFEEARVALERALTIDPEFPDARYELGLVREHLGDFADADACFQAAHDLEPEAFIAPTRMSSEDFDARIEEVLESLPDDVRDEMKKVQIMVGDLPERIDSPTLLGFYMTDPSPVIFVFKRNLERVSVDRAMLLEEIRTTVLHEIGHHLGLEEHEVHERGLG